MRMHLLEQRDAEVEASLDGDAVVVDRPGFRDATGWELKPEGMCRGHVCVPVAGTGIVDDDRIDVSRFVECMGQTLVVDHDRRVAAVAGDPMGRGQVGSLVDVELPDLDGGQLRFGDLVGRKTLLIAWASW